MIMYFTLKYNLNVNLIFNASLFQSFVVHLYYIYIKQNATLYKTLSLKFEISLSVKSVLLQLVLLMLY